MKLIAASRHDIAVLLAKIEGLSPSEWRYVRTSDHVRGLHGPEHELIVVNNAATFETLDYAYRRNIPVRHVKT